MYVRNPEAEIDKDRAKREVTTNGTGIETNLVDTSPIDNNSIDNSPFDIVTPPTPPKELNTTNVCGEYTQYVQELHDPSKLAIEVTKLRHFTQYTITVRACRKEVAYVTNKEQDMLLPGPEENPDPCSLPTQVTITTAKKYSADDIPLVTTTTVPSNQSYGIVKVEWKAPEHPNGVLLSYTIKYRKNEIENANWESVCIPHQNYLNQSFYLLKPLSNGKSSFVSLRGAV